MKKCADCGKPENQVRIPKRRDVCNKCRYVRYRDKRPDARVNQRDVDEWAQNRRFNQMLRSAFG
jgi:hypothetical protein